MLPILVIFFPLSIFSITDALKLKIQNSTHSDEAIVRFLSNATDGFDSSYDAWKFISTNPLVPAIYSKIDSVSCLSINAMPSLFQDRDITIYSRVGTIGNYSITSTEIGLFPANVSIYLEDTETGISTDIRTNGIYSFYVSDTGLYNSNKDRFVLHFTIQTITSALPILSNPNFNFSINESNINISHNNTLKEIIIYNIEGKIVFQSLVNNNEINIDASSFKNQIVIIYIEDENEKVFINKHLII